MTRTAWTNEIVAIAPTYGVDVDLAEAIVIVESAGNPFAYNPEPRYRYLWNVKTHAPFRALTAAEIASKVPPADFPTLAGDRDQEFWSQQASFGLMQLMGALARELGFRGEYLLELVRPELNLDLGCRHLGALLRWAHGDVPRAVAAYNAGRGGWNSPAGQAYAAKVQGVHARLGPRP